MPEVSLAVIQPSRDLKSERDRDLALWLGRMIDGEVRFGRHDRMLYSTDASIYQVEPIGVAIPKSRADLLKIVEFARDHRLALLPRGGGTSLAGQCVNEALVVDASKFLRDVIDVDVVNKTCRVQPGVVLDQLNAHLSQYGLMFGPDVATSAHATIGGMIGNNSAGARSILYGRTVENVAAVECALADGRVLTFDEGASERSEDVAALTREVARIVRSVQDDIRAGYPKTVRNSGGYLLDTVLKETLASSQGSLDRVNLARLLCGSEGTLAVTLEATLNLVPAPKEKGLAIVSFPSVDEALERLVSILELKPSAVELLDDVVIDMARRNIECSRYVEMLPRAGGEDVRAALYVEFFADSHRAIRERFDAVTRTVAPNRAECLTDPKDMADAWKLRKSGEPLLHAIPGPRKPVTFIEDTAVAPARLAAFVKEFKQIVAGYGTTAAYWAHASVGCLHIRPMVDIKSAADRDLMRAIAGDVVELVKRYGGTFSGEHGDGRVRSHLLEQFYGPRIYQAFREIKNLFDPENRLNPGNIVGPPEMLESLRVKPTMEGQVIGVGDVETYFRYEHGLGAAVEECIGAGVCRRRSGGTMCPSYRGTLDERHATRGRGNALRLAITGQLNGTPGGSRWDNEETMNTLDLCLSCKACKAECPTNVDIAKLKAEYAAQRYRECGASLAARLIGNVRALNGLGAVMPALTNALARFPLSRAVLNRVMRFDSRRSLPPFAKSLYRQTRNRTSSESDRPAVILLADCFTTYNEPHIGLSAIRILEAFGYRVVLPGAGCCGRSMISVGLLDRAQIACARTARELHCALSDHSALAILGLEPSCVSALKDDWLDLKMDVDATMLNEIASRAMLVEEFLEARWDEHPSRPEFDTERSPRVLLHGHCHQKALWGVESSSKILQRVFGNDRVEVLDTGCCGMAGSFGYAREHYDLSMIIAEQMLLPAVRENPSAEIAAPGTSCRHQIHDGAGKVAKHPVELLAEAIRNP